MEAPKLKLHEQRCNKCRYYRIHKGEGSVTTDCLLLGRMLSIGLNSPHLDIARYCDGWKRLPKIWEIRTEKNPYWNDKYIPRTTLINLRKRYGIK